MSVGRTIVYATLCGVLLLWLPYRLLVASGREWPAAIDRLQASGATLAGLGAVLVVWCLLTLVVAGRRPDPRNRLAVSGAYRYVRNPMYLGAMAILAGAALFHRSEVLAAYALVFMMFAHLLVAGYEEPKLIRTFPHAYSPYRSMVRRWLPGRPYRVAAP